MNKALALVTVCLAVAVLILALALVMGRNAAANPPAFSTSYEAVLLDNGQVYYGKISKLGTEFPEMTDVYYIVNEQDTQTKTIKHVLVKRGKELHAPKVTYLEARHIIMIEPVGPESEVAKLIAQSDSQASR